ncbi:hypothetical protein [Pseudomonas sp. BF-R-19]|uniref:hypothetical protein n=1 Tax=Pseudomonas sp. BF-R-19 TaxID=2832397 RepID=UPI001CC0FBBB|nr:hypothetical protein [Pseudomonas sp. BF-R-19]
MPWTDAFTQNAASAFAAAQFDDQMIRHVMDVFPMDKCIRAPFCGCACDDFEKLMTMFINT